jgi:hypothetical protein
MPASLTLDVEDVGRIENVEIAVQGVELVLDAWAGIVRMWRHLLAVEAGLATLGPLTPSDTLESPSSPHSRASPLALNESFSRCAITSVTKPCIDLVALLRAQFKILVTNPRFHYYLYIQGIPRRAFDSGLVLARIVTLCIEEQDRPVALQALGALRDAIDLLEQAAGWFKEQSGEPAGEEAETLKLLRMLLAHTNNRVELLEVNTAGSKRSREAMEGMSDISAARLGDLHGLRLPFTNDTLILDTPRSPRSPSMTQQTRTQSTFHHHHLAGPPVKSNLSSVVPSPSSMSPLSSIDANVVPEPSPSVTAEDPALRGRKPTPVRPQPTPPVLKEEPRGEGREVERGPVAKLRKIQPKGMVQHGSEDDPRASQATRGVTMNLDQVSVPLVVQDTRSDEHRLQALQQRPVNSAFTSSPDDLSYGGMTSSHSGPTLWTAHQWHGIPSLTPARVAEAHVHPHANLWAPPTMLDTTMAGVISYVEEPYTSMATSATPLAPVASAPLLRASMGGSAVRTYASYPPMVSTAAASEVSPAHSYFSSSYGPSPLPQSASSLTSAPTPDPAQQPSPHVLAPQPQHPQQWHYESVTHRNYD